MRLTQITAVRQPPRSDHDAEGGLVVTDRTEIRTIAEQLSTADVAEDTVDTITAMKSILDERGKPVTWLAHSAQPYLGIYASGDAEAVRKSGPRARPRVASIHYSRKGLRMTFGRRVANRGESGPAYGDEWDELVAELQTAPGREASSLLSGATFRTSTYGYPLVVEGVGATQVSALAALIARIYDIG